MTSPGSRPQRGRSSAPLQVVVNDDTDHLNLSINGSLDDRRLLLASRRGRLRVHYGKSGVPVRWSQGL